MIFDFEYALSTLPDMLGGLLVALQAVALGYPLALALGLVFALLRRSRLMVISVPTAFVVEFIRSTPLLVQLFFFFYVLPQIGLSVGPLATGAIALGLHYATYISEVYRSGIDNVPAGQWEAATALNLPTSRTWTDVILPQAIPRVIPALGNYVIAMFKDTPLLIAVTLAEMLTVAIDIGGDNFRFAEPITVAGVLYLLTALVLAYFARLLERHYGQVRAA
jgi:polar amino acid transport system permease protein